MARYDNRVLHEFADKLLAEADRTVVIFTLVGGLAGVIAGVALGGGSPNVLQWVAACAVAAALLGGMIGLNRAFALRIQAQTLLCQVQIEENTRRAASAVPDAEAIAFGSGVRKPKMPPPV